MLLQMYFCEHVRFVFVHFLVFVTDIVPYSSNSHSLAARQEKHKIKNICLYKYESANTLKIL